MLLDRNDRPDPQYLGLLSTWIRTGDPKAENLKQIVAKGDSPQELAKVSPNGEINNLVVARDLETEDPTGAMAYRRKIRIMSTAWVSMSLAHPGVSYLQGLRLETFTAFADYALGPDAGAAQRGDGQRPKWEDVLKCERAVRQSWWEHVEEGKTLNDAILLSIGAGASKNPSGLWQSMLVNRLALQKQRDERPGTQGEKWPRTSRKGDEGKKGGGPSGSAPGKGDRGKGDRGKGAKDGKGGKGPPPAFAGKLLWCVRHNKRICFDRHLGGCSRPNCGQCHSCCPQPGCAIDCSDRRRTVGDHR